ncbi:hypothetical protein QBC33DRAFT_603692 [Phialemonium atrogriseum]|uniref:GH16 domain-containing protein n=1 Tax=Phialemonium atrogriseum TaxID=1093897 RepID=A0AAJ0FAY0_9PEZI|nr:uncharacterized protein QBC33DRAFT_603692 [Phialemonium atrogriseum]KAK1761876.1 hypothetical protein QBC33DRAFT_603692 [Phialemonium atrogriseum]
MKTLRGAGVVTAFTLFGDVKDEIDYEFVVWICYESAGTLGDLFRHHLVSSLPSRAEWILALSYVWGKVLMRKALKANMLTLEQPGALSQEFAAKIPATIQRTPHAYLQGRAVLALACRLALGAEGDWMTV